LVMVALKKEGVERGVGWVGWEVLWPFHVFGYISVVVVQGACVRDVQLIH
jgi:hypothetical protein